MTVDDRVREVPAARHRTPELEKYLLDQPEASPLDDDIRTAGLAGDAYLRGLVPADAGSFRMEFAHFAARHLAVRSALRELLVRLASHGIESLVFKGFYLAEFVYDAPGARSYADVDLLLRPHAVDEACDAAEAAGWQVHWRASDADHMLAVRDVGYLGHEAAQLRHPTLDVMIDVHRRVVHNNHNRVSPSRDRERLTDAVWNESRRDDIDGAPVRVLRPEDAVVFGLALNRCWGSDDWRIKPRDYRDAQALVRRFALTSETVLARARQLGVGRTVDLFLRRCDPWRQRVRLAPPSWLELRAWNLAVLSERGPRDLIAFLIGARDVPRQGRALATALPHVLRARRELRRRSGDRLEPTHVVAPTDRTLRPFGRRDWLGVRRGVHRVLRLLGIRGEKRDALTVLALQDALLRRGYDAVAELPELPTAGAGRPRLLLDGEPLALGNYASSEADAPDG